MRKPFLNQALESIDFQSDAFLRGLAIYGVQFKEIPKKDRPDHDLVQKLEKYINDVTGLNITVVLGNYEPSMEIPSMHKNNILINNWRRNFMNSSSALKMVENAPHALSGAVDKKTGRVSGIFSEVPVTVYMPDSIFDNNYEPEEFAAVLQHECGHAVTFFEYFGHTATSNQALAGIARAMEDSDVQVRVVVLETVRKQFNLKNFDVDKLSKSNNKVVEVAFISNVAEESRSQLGRNIYDLSSFEYLSDQYVARHGGTRYLATALAKIYKGQYHISFRSLPAYLSIEILKIALFLYVPGFAMMLFAYDGQGTGDYDQPGARLKRVRNQAIEALKDKKLSKEKIEDLNMDIKAIDEVLYMANDRRQWVGIMIDFFWLPSRRDRDFVKLQQDLEGLAANELFAKSAEWRALA